jgi:hypothetical protein
MFNKTIKSILKKCSDCNVFSLTTSIDFKISGKDANHALEVLKQYHKNYLLEEYEKNKNQYSLPSFEQLYDDIQQECIKFKEHNDDEDHFICDEVGFTTKYSEPLNFFWHFYNMIETEKRDEKLLNTYINYSNNKNHFDILELEQYQALKPYVIKDEISFITHCTIGPLSQTIYFKLNEETKKWLLQYKCYYDIHNDLQDLAIYKDSQIVFSSCTHEKFYSYE